MTNDDDTATILAPLLSTHQTTEYTRDPVDGRVIQAIADVARRSGSANNRQPWRFIVIRREQTIRAIAEAGLPHTVTLSTAPAAIAFVLPDDAGREVVDAYDDGRAAERVLIAATMLGLGASISWIRPDVQPAVRAILAIPSQSMVRTVMAIGHPTPEARRPRSGLGPGRLPRSETIRDERWSDDGRT